MKAGNICYGVRGHAGVINDAARAGRPGNVVPISHGRGPVKDFNISKSATLIGTGKWRNRIQ